MFPAASGRKSTIAVTSSERLGQPAALETCECVIMQIQGGSGMREEVEEQEVGRTGGRRERREKSEERSGG